MIAEYPINSNLLYYTDKPECQAYVREILVFMRELEGFWKV